MMKNKDKLQNGMSVISEREFVRVFALVSRIFGLGLVG